MAGRSRSRPAEELGCLVRRQNFPLELLAERAARERRVVLRLERPTRDVVAQAPAGQIVRSTSSFLISPIALAGLRLLGQVLVQFMIVWQR